MPRRPFPEREFHKAAAAYLRSVLPEDAFFTTFPAGGGGRIRGAQLKAMGLQAGVPDLMIIYKGEIVFIELKAAKGRLSETQMFVSDKLCKAGAFVFMCRTIEEIETILIEMIGAEELRGKIAA